MPDITEIEQRFEAAATLHEQGRLADAEAHCHAILNDAPSHAPSVSLMGIVLCMTGRADMGVQFIAKACELAPDEVAFQNNLGTALSGLGHHEEAIGAFQKALAMQPDYAPAHNNIGAALRPAGRLDEAAAHYSRAVELAPDNAEAWANYANVLMDLNRIEDAGDAARKATALCPDYAVGHNNLGTVSQRQGQYGAAETSFRRALEISPDYADALSNLGEVLKETGRAAEALEYYQRSVDLSPDEPAMGSNMLLAMCAAELPPDEIADAHRAWGTRLETGDTENTFAGRDRSPDRRLRIGYVSPDYRRHSVTYFLDPIFAHHDRDTVEVFAYANMAEPGDAVTERLKGHAGHWRNIFGMDDMAFAQLVSTDQIDILVDLAGHTRANRLAAFAVRAAPIQMSYLGYPATTGLTRVDWRLADGWTDPIGVTEAFHTEHLARIDGGFLCYRPDDDAPAVAPPPALVSGQITFGSFNNLAKVTPGVVETWAAVLNAVPGSRLMVKAKSLGDADTAGRLTAAFQARGIEAARLKLVGWITEGNPLAAYGQIDIGLDTFPYNGTTTTCEALWMGVPVITLGGTWHAARVGVSLLSKISLSDCIATDTGDYVTKATSLAAKLDSLTELRTGMRDRVLRGGLTDGAAFTQSLEATYREAWRTWCRYD